MSHVCTVEVAEPYLDGAGKQRARWARRSPETHSAVSASERVKELRKQHGAARITCPAFEAVALRQSFGLKLIEGAS